MKEQEVIKSLLMSDFYWVDIDSEGEYASDKSFNRIFKGSVCPKATFWNYETDDNKIFKKWTNIDECKEWLPENALHESFKEYRIDKTGKNSEYQRFIKNISADTKLLLQINQGSISGGKGWEITVGIIYKNFIFKLYDYKKSDNKYRIKALYNIDYIRSLDLSNMNKLNTTLDLYMSEYYAVRTFQSTGSQDMADVLGLAMTDDTLTFSDKFIRTFSEIQGISATSDCIFNRETLSALQPKKIIMQDNFDLESRFDIPDSLKEIVLDFESNKYDSVGIMEQFIDRNKTLGKYLNCSDDCEKLAARELFHKEEALYSEQVNLWFEYKELKGFINSNKYQLNLLENYYKDAKSVTLKVGDAEFDMHVKKFWDCIRIEKKIKYASKMHKAMEYFGDRNGYTAWFPKECDVRPEYKFDAKKKK